MKNLPIPIFLMLLTFLNSCDTLEKDAIPQEVGAIDLQEKIFSTPNTPLIFDLKKSLNLADKGSLRTKLDPQKGRLSFMDKGFLKYTPEPTFTSGVDFFVMEALSSSGSIVDTDTINIFMVGDTTELPCFNGALSDHVITFTNAPVTFNVIKNDGYCTDETTGAIVEVILEPAHGQVSLSDLFTYTYTPNQGFTGSDSLIYSLELIDLNGESYYSTALVNINVKDIDDTCQIHLNNDFFWFDDNDSSGYILNVLANDKLCPNQTASIFIQSQPGYGTAEVYDHPASNFAHIIYYPSNSSSHFIDSLTYGIYDNDQILYLANVAVEVNTEECFFQPMDDHFIVTEDSISQEDVDDAILEVLANDNICNWEGLEYGISNDNNSKGTATFVENRVHYSPPEGFSGVDTVKYMVCELAAECKTARAFIEVK